MKDGILDKLQIFLFILLAFSLPLSITLSETFYFLVFLVWLTKTIARKHLLRRTGLEIPILVLVVVYILSILLSPSPLESAKILKKLVLFGLFFIIANSLDSETEKSRLIKIWLLGAVIASVWTVIEYFRGINRPGGTTFGHLTSMFLYVSLPLVGLKNYKWLPILPILVLATGIPALFLNCTRGAWISFITILILLLIAKRKWLFLTASATVLVSITLILLIYFPNSKLGETVVSLLRPFDKQVPRVVVSNLRRWYMWKASWIMFTKHPLLGVGFSQFEQELPNHLSEEVQVEIFKHLSSDHAHSIYFDGLAKTGIIGFSALLFFLYTIFRLLASKYKSYNPSFDKNLVLGVLIAFTSFCISGFFDQVLHDSELLLNLCFLLGLVL